MDELVERLTKEIKVQCSKPKEGKKGQRRTPQYFIQIPKEVIIELGIKKGDKVIIDVPLKDKKNYSIKFKKLK